MEKYQQGTSFFRNPFKIYYFMAMEQLSMPDPKFCNFLSILKALNHSSFTKNATI